MDHHPKSQNFVEQIGQMLKMRALLDDHALARARRIWEQTGERFDHILTRLGLVSETDMAGCLASLFSMSLLEPADFPDEAVLPESLPLAFLKRHKLLPIAETDSQITIAMADPFNEEAIRAVSYACDREVLCTLALQADFEKALERLYEQGGGADHTAANPFSDEQLNDRDIERLKDIASEAPIIQLVHQLISQAVERGASDIHIEPLETFFRVRFRIDGLLHEVRQLPLSMCAAVTSRVKILGKLNIAERRLPQDGRIKLAVRGSEIDLRLSTTPTLFGESIVLRILDQTTLDLDFSVLGFYGETYQNYLNLLDKPNGILLVTGPTGSGKTTTLYTSLKTLNKTERKIFTVEDPVEYQLSGINQVQVHPKVGLTFAAALRSILRQDPDIIMIGEIRDLETAQIAIQSSLTGHLVLSTLHTNSAIATITRLLDMGVDDYLLASTVTGVLAQRLVRRLCPHCAEPMEVTEAFLDKYYRSQGLSIDRATSHFRKAKGCAKCHFTGFSGRTTIMELLIMTDALREQVSASTSLAHLEDSAIKAGMTTLYRDGLEKVRLGQTTLEEILRVTQLK